MQSVLLLQEAAERARLAASVAPPEAASALRKAAEALERASARVPASTEELPELTQLARQARDVAARLDDGAVRVQAAAFEAVGRLLDESPRAAVLWCEPLCEIGAAMRHLVRASRKRREAEAVR
jgi:hypothetical protein